jgi:glycosyltransferase involved in cell wall biosynthesis
VGVDVLNWRLDFDLRPLLSLRSLIAKERPEIVLAWGFGAAWPLVLIGRSPRTFFLVGALPPKRRLSLAERWLLRHCGRLIAIGEAEGDAYQRLGLLPAHVSRIPPAASVESVPISGSGPLPGLPEEARVILAVGPLTMHKGHRDAVWAFDILRCLYDDLHLVIVGSGPDEERLRRFAQIIRLNDIVHFTGPVSDLRPWLARAEVVWAPSLREGGRQTVLEAMAAGRAVVASRLPGLAEVMVDGQTGYLVTPGDKADLSRQTRILLDHADLRWSMGEAGRRRVADRFTPARMIQAFSKVFS